MNRVEFFTAISDRLHADELDYVQKAYWFAKEVHRTQIRRLTGKRYFEHLRNVAFLAADKFGYYDAETIALGILHDSIEDTFAPSAAIVSLFGENMYENILTLSKEIPVFHSIHGKMICRAKVADQGYYHGLANAPQRVKIIKGCDRLDNVSDLDLWTPERREKYVRETVDKVLPIVRNADIRIWTAIVEKLPAGSVVDTKVA